MRQAGRTFRAFCGNSIGLGISAGPGRGDECVVFIAHRYPDFCSFSVVYYDPYTYIARLETRVSLPLLMKCVLY